MAEEIRLGVIVPSVNIVVERWYPAVLPEGVGVHFARMLLADRGGPEKIVEMDKTDGVRAIHQLKSARPHAIAYGFECRPGPRLRRASARRDHQNRRRSGDDRDA
jgi:maleate cis-trans isomerase